MSKRSPLFYVGDKYKLIDEIKKYFPKKIENFIEPFVGGGSVFMNVKAEKYILNDINPAVISLHKMLCEYSTHKEDFFEFIDKTIMTYGLSCSYREDIIPDSLKSEFKKTYYAKFNKEKFNLLKRDYNLSTERDPRILYILLIYGFNRMIRFNSKNEYNLPVGNVDFNNNVIEALNNYFEVASQFNLTFENCGYRDFLQNAQLTEKDLVYLDPPYLITFSEYNKLWNDETEKDLLSLLDEFNDKNIKFAISNVTHYKGRVNEIFYDWSRKYNEHIIHSNYISFHDNSVKEFKEVLITNY